MEVHWKSLPFYAKANAPLSHYNLSIHINSYIVRVHSNSFTYYYLKVIWIIIPLAMEFQFRTRTLCVPHTSNTHFLYHFYYSLLFQLECVSVFINFMFVFFEKIPPRWKTCFAMEWMTVFHDINWYYKAWMKNPGTNGMIENLNVWNKRNNNASDNVFNEEWTILSSIISLRCHRFFGVYVILKYWIEVNKWICRQRNYTNDVLMLTVSYIKSHRIKIWLLNICSEHLNCFGFSASICGFLCRFNLGSNSIIRTHLSHKNWIFNYFT